MKLQLESRYPDYNPWNPVKGKDFEYLNKTKEILIWIERKWCDIYLGLKSQIIEAGLLKTFPPTGPRFPDRRCSLPPEFRTDAAGGFPDRGWFPPILPQGRGCLLWT